MEEFLTTKDLMNIFKVSRFTITLWKKKPDFPRAFQAGKKSLWKKSEVDAYIETTRVALKE